MDYEEMSDLTIDRKVFVQMYGECIGDKDMDRVWQQGRFRPCNNPSDSWPIIFDNRISLSPQDNGNEWEAGSVINPDFGFEFECWDKNPLRAAMICFLKMKDTENGKH